MTGYLFDIMFPNLDIISMTVSSSQGIFAGGMPRWIVEAVTIWLTYGMVVFLTVWHINLHNCKNE